MSILDGIRFGIGFTLAPLVICAVVILILAPFVYMFNKKPKAKNERK